MFADEPTGDVDEETARELLNLLQEEIARGMALVVATHGIFPLNTADTLYSLNTGELIQS
jgi:ABC-type lipoprotein export system ATPase subunit